MTRETLLERIILAQVVDPLIVSLDFDREAMMFQERDELNHPIRYWTVEIGTYEHGGQYEVLRQWKYKTPRRAMHRLEALCSEAWSKNRYLKGD